MSKVPSLQSILLNVHQIFACKWPGNSELKNKFFSGDCSLEKLMSLNLQLCKDIFDATEMDNQARDDALANILEFSSGLTELYSNLWTFKASSRQVVWMLLTHHFIPGLARYMANWQLEERWDRGMPGGKFWYLPERRSSETQTKIVMPVSQVIEWLIDLIGTSIETLADTRSEATDGVHDALRRSLYKWMNDTLPEASTIRKYFNDDVVLPFSGAFTLRENQSLNEAFQSALTFVCEKDLTPENLRFEIPMTEQGRLEEVFEGNISDDEKLCFINCIVERYSKPSMQTIRQRLLVARAAQEGYIKLLNFLCPEVDRLCADPAKNKLLQVSAIYEMIFNATIEASKQKRHLGLDAENVHFESLIPIPYRPMLVSILPSMKMKGVTALASDLTRQFWEMAPESSLQDVVALLPEQLEPILIQTKNTIDKEMIIDLSINNLLSRITTSSPWRALQKESNFWVVSQVAKHPLLTPDAKSAACARLKELAANPDQLVSAFCVELESLIGQPELKLNKSTKAQVEKLLSQIDETAHSRMSNPVILRLKGFHSLYSNDFKTAEGYFRQAIDECDKGQYGPLKGTLARDAFCVAVATNKVNPNNHQKYFRLMLLEGIIESRTIPDIEDIAIYCSELFWGTLYKTYPQYPKLNHKDIDLFEQSTKIIFSQDENLLANWLMKNRVRLEKSMADVRGDTLLLTWIKMRNDFMNRLSIRKPHIPHELKDDMNRLEQQLSFWHNSICMIIKTIPKSVNVTDFKGQSPLMLAAQTGDTLLVNTLLANDADPDLQDFKGRTALHAAIKSGNLDIIKAILEKQHNLDLTTYDGMTALHTACWRGNLEAVKLLSTANPMLAWTRYQGAPTPLEFVEMLLNNTAYFESYNIGVQKEGYAPLSKAKLKEVYSILELVEYSTELKNTH